jgi:hypothetical protein
MRSMRLATAIAASAALALTLTGCGGDDDNGAAKPTQASSGAASATSTTATSRLLAGRRDGRPDLVTRTSPRPLAWGFVVSAAVACRES